MKKLVIIILAILLVMGSSYFLYADTIEKTTITCTDEKMFESLRNKLGGYILLPSDVDINELTIKIPTDDIKKITELNLENCEISDITGIENFTYLKKINLARNKISDITPIDTLTSLEEINLSNNSNLGASNSIKTILPKKANLKTLKISNIGLSDISFLGQLKNLTSLYMSGITVNSLIDISGLTNLVELDVSSNMSLRSIKTVLNFKKLKILDLSNTGIDKLELDGENEVGIYNLTQLEELYLRSTNIEDMSIIVKTYYKENAYQDEEGNWYGDDVSYMPNMRVLDLGYINRNNDKDVVGFYELRYFTKLEKLYMPGNHISDVSSIVELSNLVEINLAENDIEDLSGFLETENVTDDNGNEYEIVKRSINAISIDLHDNIIVDVTPLGRVLNKKEIISLDLQNNRIYDVSALEDVGTVEVNIRLYNQDITFPIFYKKVPLNQYMILLPIMQQAKNPNSIVYDENSEYITKECTLNDDPEYQRVGLYNVIIDHKWRPEDTQNTDEEPNKDETIMVTLSGGIADGSKIKYVITEDIESRDSLKFNDVNLERVVYNSLSEKILDGPYLIQAEKIVNAHTRLIDETDELDASNKNITDLTGLESLYNLEDLDVSKNTGIKTLNPIKYCTNILKLNASNTSIKNDYSAIMDMKELETLLLNNTGMTSIRVLNEYVEKILEEDMNINLKTLDISSNIGINDINGVEKIVSLLDLIVSNTSIEETPSLKSLANLERLSMYSNKLDKIPEIAGLRKLSYIYMANNKINNLANITGINCSLKELDLSNNLIDDEEINNLANINVTRKLNISGNMITNVTPLKNYLGTLQELNVSKNRISDVSVIDGEFSPNSYVDASNQKIALGIESASENVVEIDLPQIFRAAKDSTGFFYTAENFITQNCTISGTKVIININEIGNNIATVKINGGNATGTTLSIVPPIKTEIRYNKETITNQDVTATITFTNRATEDITILNNNGSNEYKFEKNGEFTFEYIDKYGLNGETKAIVNWIDKTSPVITGILNGKVYENAVTPSVADENLDTVILTKDGQNVEDYVLGNKISEAGAYKIIATDKAGNTSNVSFQIKNKIEEQSDIITSSTYTVSEGTNIIKNIKQKTTVNSIKENLQHDMNYVIKDLNGREVSGDTKVGTGYTIVMENGKVYTIIVSGDINGDGDIKINDLARAQKVFLSMVSLNSVQNEAIDLNNNNRFDINDLAKIQKMYIGLIK